MSHRRVADGKAEAIGETGAVVRRSMYAPEVTKAKRERKEKAKAEAQSKRATDRARREREAFAKKLDAAKKGAETTPATGIVDDVE